MATLYPGPRLRRVAFLALFSSIALGAWCISGRESSAVAAGVRQPIPSISITQPANGSTIHGGTVTVTVHIQNFRLVAPVFKGRLPVLPMNAGHIHYYLDNAANFVLARNSVASLTHSWTNVTPGRHTVYAYLATSQHVPYPGTKTASATVYVASPPGVRSPVHSGGGGFYPGTTSPLYGIGFMFGLIILAAGLAVFVHGSHGEPKDVLLP